MVPALEHLRRPLEGRAPKMAVAVAFVGDMNGDDDKPSIVTSNI